MQLCTRATSKGLLYFLLSTPNKYIVQEMQKSYFILGLFLILLISTGLFLMSGYVILFLFTASLTCVCGGILNKYIID